MYGSEFFGNMGHTECPSCGAWTVNTWENDLCGDVICRWCEPNHDDECGYHQDICPDHPCEMCIDRAVDAAMYRMEDCWADE